MTPPLLPGVRMTAYWYALHAGLLAGSPDDREFLADLGLHAARLARHLGIPAWRVPEGPYLVHAWPPEVWAPAAAAMAEAAAATGSWCPSGEHYGGGDWQRPPGSPPYGYPEHGDLPHGYQEAGDLDYVPEVIPPWCPLPQGDQARFAIGY